MRRGGRNVYYRLADERVRALLRIAQDLMADHARELLGLGANVIGACCGSTPAHIAAMRDALAASTRDG
jgi:methionine synthase I (cobalamin-dependent)